MLPTPLKVLLRVLELKEFDVPGSLHFVEVVEGDVVIRIALE